MQLLRLAVDPLHQNKGIGSQLMEALLKESQELLTLEVRESNKKALKFYEKFGFQKGKKVPMLALLELLSN